MGKKIPEGPPVDEQGQPWPPPECPAARIVDYGGAQLDPLNGALVSLGPYYEAHGLFEAYVTEPAGAIAAGEAVLCWPRELELLNDAASAHVASFLQNPPDFYEDEVYDLRDLLSEIGVQVTASSVADWLPEQRLRVRAFALAARDLPEGQRPSKPKELP